MENLPASKQIDGIIADQASWKSEVLSQLRAVILSADPAVIEEVKWKTPSRPAGLPVWSHNGILCIAEIWKDNIKLIFFKGALLKDPKKIFNARLKSKTDRALEFREGDTIDEQSLKQLILEAIELNSKKK